MGLAIPGAEFLGGQPKVPKFVPVDAQEEQRKAIAGNITALPGAAELGSGVNAAMAAEYEKMRQQAFGGYYDRIKEATTKNIYDWVSGNVDVSDIISKTAAKNFLNFGGRTGFGDMSTIRNSVDYVNQMKAAGLTAFERWGRATETPIYDISRSFISPQEQLSHAVEERNAKFQHDYVKNQWDWYGSWGQMLTRADNTASIMLSAIAGTATGMGSSAAGMCWVAREVFGETNPKWLQFRHWLLTQSSGWFLKLYRKYGERFAAFIQNKPALKKLIRRWMESKIKKGATYAKSI